MSQPCVIRIEAVRHDQLASVFEGVAIRREADGALSRQRLRIAGEPTWTHGTATRALRQAAARG